MPTEIEYIPMSLSCFCPQGIPVSCDIIRLHITVAAGTDTTLNTWSLSSPGLAPISVNDTEVYDSDIPIEWANASVSVFYHLDRSLLLTGLQKGSANVVAFAEYACGDGSHFTMEAFITASNSCVCSDEDGIRGFANIIFGSASGVIYKSSPLGGSGSCNGCAIEATGVFIVPTNPLVDAKDTLWCICATGGTVAHFDEGDVYGPKKYYIVEGHLAAGQTLNEDTGCVSGVADERFPASLQITFGAMDVVSGERVTTTCGSIVTGCTGSEGISTPNNYTYVS